METRDMILICKALSDTNRLEIVQMLSDVFWNRNINWDYLMIRSDTVMKKGNVQ